MNDAPADMPQIRINRDGKDHVVYTLPEALRDDVSSMLYYTLPKSGSVMLNHIISALQQHMRLRFVYLDGVFFQNGIPVREMGPSLSDMFRDRGYCYGFPTWSHNFENPLLGKVPTMVHVRDIRDALVSRYYSHRTSHPVPGELGDFGFRSEFDVIRKTAQETDIQDMVISLAETDMGPRYKRFYEMAQTYDVRVSRYEDLVYRKRASGSPNSAIGWVGTSPTPGLIRSSRPWTCSPHLRMKAITFARCIPATTSRS